MVKDNNIRVRFAPSPTGYLHVGNSRVAIFNWLYAKHKNGTYLLRMEDTDIKRSTKEFLDSQLKSLEWLGLLPDEPILYQMSRLEEHKKVVQKLLDKNLVYPCFCDPLELDKKRAQALQDGKTYKYDGTCRKLKNLKDYKNEPHAIRFKIPSDCKGVEFNDLVRGSVYFDAEQLDDFIIMRRDGTPTYNFVVVVDDITMRISHVIRGEDHISNTPKQILIYRALEAELPKFAHLPMILGPSGNRLSKRDAATSVKEYREQGFLSDALFNYLVRLGWSHGDQEIFTKQELIKYFDFDHVGKKGAVFDIKKLEWLNAVYLRKKTYLQLLDAIKDMSQEYYEQINKFWDQENLEKLFELYKQRATGLLDMVLDIISLAKVPEYLDLSLIKKWHTPKTLDLLKLFVNSLEEAEELAHTNLKDLAKNICDKFDVKFVALAQPLRLALTGKTFSPGVFELIEILGKEIVIIRVKNLINKIEDKA